MPIPNFDYLAVRCADGDWLPHPAIYEYIFYLNSHYYLPDSGDWWFK